MVIIMVIDKNNSTAVKEDSKYDVGPNCLEDKQKIEDTAEQLINDNLVAFWELAK